MRTAHGIRRMLGTGTAKRSVLIGFGFTISAWYAARPLSVKPVALCIDACITLYGCTLINDKGVDGAQHANRVLIEIHAHDVALAYG